MEPFEFQFRSRVIFGADSVGRVGELARDLGFRKTLLVADRGIVESGYTAAVMKHLQAAGVSVCAFHDFDVNPDSAMAETGRDAALALEVDSLIGLGGGSSMDCAKAINFLVTNGGAMQDYWGFGKASKPMLPMIGIPTTSGTGSEAQSYALISDPRTHVKMACGDPKAIFRIVILDPCLTVTQPAHVTATAGYDAISHAVETYVTKRRSPVSDLFAREAWRLLEGSFERVVTHPGDVEARSAMQLGAYYAGVAIENSMLGATHACANPLTARYGTIHGVAIAALLSHVVNWNQPVAVDRYRELALVSSSRGCDDLISRLKGFADAGRLSTNLRTLGVPRSDLPGLAEEAARQWTGAFNPRAFDATGALEIYESAY